MPHQTIILTLFSLFLIFGNLTRFWGIPLVDGCLILAALPYFRKTWIPWALACLATILVGVLQLGMDAKAAFYALKLLGTIYAGLALGQVLFQKYGDDVASFSRFICLLFAGHTLVGFFIFFFFPHSTVLYATLENLGIKFYGDPHIHRFISPFLDPNFFAAVACIPLLLVPYLKKGKWLFSLLFLSAIILTRSRSGLVTAFLSLVLLCFRYPKFLGGIALFGLASTPFVARRFFYMGEDPAALARFQTWREGWELLMEHPFFGTGYHFTLAPIDSSPLLTLISFGLIPSTCLLIGAAVWLKKNPLPYQIVGYLLICLLFTSHFNNLLYYQSWLIPMIIILSYARKSRLNTRLARHPSRSRKSSSSDLGALSSPPLHPR